MKRPLSQFAGEYQEWEPTAALRDHLFRVWVNDLSTASTEQYCVVPDGCVDILWTGESLYVAGPDTRPFLAGTGDGLHISGIRFHPGAAYAWLGMPLSELLNARVPLTDIWGPETARLVEDLREAPGSLQAVAILERALLDRIGRIGLPEPQIAFLRSCANQSCAFPETRGLTALSLKMGVSERTIHRRCIESFGYGFKTLQRILRFQRMFRLAMLSPQSALTDIAFDTGFADQAHMSREVQRLGGATPSEFVGCFAGRSDRFVQDHPCVPLLESPHEKAPPRRAGVLSAQ